MVQAPVWAPLAALATMAASTGSLAGLMALRDGVRAIVVPQGDDAHAFVGRVFKFGILAGVVFCIVYAMRPSVVADFGPLDWFASPAAAWVGVAMMAVGAAVVVIAQIGMGASWRVGIDSEHRTGLVTQGLYRFSRN